MPGISIPVGLILSPFTSRISKWFLWDTYVASHQCYQDRNGFLRRWDDLGGVLKLSVSIESILDNGRSPSVHIAVKLAQPSHPVDRVTLLVEARARYGIHQDTATIYRITGTPKIFVAPSVPLRSMYITDNAIYNSFDELNISILEIDPPISAYQLSEARHSLRPTNVDLLNDRFVERWGAHWNMAEVDFQIREQAHWLRFHLAQQNYYGPRSKMSGRMVMAATLRALIGRPLCWVLSREWLLKAYFWVPIFLRLRKFKVRDE